jgi:hypothetical protein
MCGKLINFISNIEVRSDYETTSSIRSEINYIGSEIRMNLIGFAHLFQWYQYKHNAKRYENVITGIVYWF